MSWPPRRAFWACAALAGVFIGCRWMAPPGQPQAAAAAPAAHAAAARPVTSPPPPPGAPPFRSARAGRDALTRDPIVEAVADPFKPVSFLPPPKVVEAAPPPPAAPPKPSAPPFPYRYPPVSG